GRLGKRIEEEIEGDEFAVPGDADVGAGIFRRRAGDAGDPADPAAVTDLLRWGERLIAKVRMAGLDHAGDAVNLLAATENAAHGVVENGIFVEDLVDGRAPADGVDLSEHVVEVAQQEGRYGGGHDVSPLGLSRGREGQAAAATGLRRLSRLNLPAPKATICSRPPASITFLRKWIIWFWSAKLAWNVTA